MEVSSFHRITVVQDGRRRTRNSGHKEFASHPSNWPRALSAIPVEIILKHGKLSVFLTVRKRERMVDGESKRWREVADPVEIISQEGLEKPASGRIVLSFDKWTFFVTNLQLEGKVHVPWAEAEIERLRKEGKLNPGQP